MKILQSLAAVDAPNSLSNRLRSRRFQRFADLVANWPRPLRIIDLGGTPEFWAQRGWAGRDDVHITTINLQARITPHANIECQHGDVLDLRSIPDQSFDIAFSNSVIEHLFTPEHQTTMAGEMQRVAGAFWLQTPNYWFPIEPHFHIPGWQWMPVSLRTALLQRFQCGWRGPCPDRADALEAVREVRLMTRRELADLFPDATIIAERFGGLVKSWVVHAGLDRAAMPITTERRHAA